MEDKKLFLDALERGEFIPFIQKIVRTKDFGVVGGELLARWKHPEKGILTPDKFINEIETDTISDLDFFMFENACRLGLEHGMWFGCNFTKNLARKPTS